MLKKMKYELTWFSYFCLFVVLSNQIFSEESSPENKFSGDWIEYSRWGFQIKRISENNETEENYNEFGKLTSKNVFNLTLPNGSNSEGQYIIKPNDYWHYLAVKKNLIISYGPLKILTLPKAIGKKERRVLATQIMMTKPFLKIWLINTNRYLLLRNS